ncbi:MAG TPA: protein kinase, partial [Thermoanaerobaculia bacterium]|nr:protein kinase [Thermoanaerobaculia bacterium]
GEVYRAKDTRLGRTVALKVLPRELSDHAERRERFEREARAISNLNHPHICVVHDVGEAKLEPKSRPRDDGADHSPLVSYLVMEYLEGETLADRLERGPLPLDQIVRYGIQIASALACAHRSGVVHRDLKPANVMLTASGAKLLDFGLATSAAPLPWVSAHNSEPGATTTRQKQRLTAEGVVLGTVHYMAPEQLTGVDTDPRTDIFSFGALLYEMATGRLAFDGSSAVSVIAAILEREPQSIRELEPRLPTQLERIVRTCLAKNPEDRFQTAHDLGLQLEWLPSELDGGDSSAVPRRPRPSRLWIAGAGAALLIAVLFGWLAGRSKPETARMVTAISPPPDATFRFAGDDSGPAVISPDGRHLVFVAADDEGRSLWLRSLQENRAARIPGTRGATFPFWSPDSRTVGFFAEEKLKRVDLDSGPPLELAPAPEGRGGTWSRDGIVVFAPTFDGELMRIDATGGKVSPVTRLDRTRHTTHRWPAFLEDGHRFLFLATNHAVSLRDRSEILLGDLRDPDFQRTVIPSASQAMADGDQLLYVRGETLVAQPFDRQGNVSGLPRPVAESVFVDPTTWRAGFSISGNGMLAHHPGGTSIGTRLVWFDRSGNRLGAVGERALIENVRISPDQRYAATDVGDSITNLWIYDLQTGLRRRLTYTAAADMLPLWSPDGTRIAFSSNRHGAFDLYLRNSDGTAGDTLLVRSRERKVASDWSPDGKYLVFNHGEPTADLWLLPLEGPPEPRPLVATPFDEYTAQFSPDGRWFAYTSHETGQQEIFIAPFPAAAPKWQISSVGGRVPRWRGDGRELFFLTQDDRMMAVTLDLRANVPEISPPRILFRTQVRPLGLSYDVTRDGQKFLINTLGEEGLQPLTLIQHWSARLNGND